MRWRSGPRNHDPSGTAKPSLVVQDRGRYQPAIACGRPAADAVADLEAGRQREREFDERMVEQRTRASSETAMLARRPW